MYGSKQAKAEVMIEQKLMVSIVYGNICYGLFCPIFDDSLLLS